MKIDGLEQISVNQKIGDSFVSWSPNPPTENKGIWFETGLHNIYGGQPWVYYNEDITIRKQIEGSQPESPYTINNPDIWLSQPIWLTLPKITLSSSSPRSIFQNYPIPYELSLTKFPNVNLYVSRSFVLIENKGGTPHNNTNYWDINLKGYNSGGKTEELFSPAQNSGFNFNKPKEGEPLPNAGGIPANFPRHIFSVVNKFIHRNIMGIGIQYDRIGNPPTELDASGLIIVRFIRAK